MAETKTPQRDAPMRKQAERSCFDNAREKMIDNVGDKQYTRRAVTEGLLRLAHQHMTRSIGTLKPSIISC
jgi:hypothetical protein